MKCKGKTFNHGKVEYPNLDQSNLFVKKLVFKHTDFLNSKQHCTIFNY